MEAQLVAGVQESLGLYLYDNACFFGERLVAEYPFEANKYLLATCYVRNNQSYRAYHLLQGCCQPASKYLLALTCVHLGKLPEAQAALQPSADGEVPMGAAGCYWLGKICQLTNRTEEAIRHYRAALVDNPLLWCAYKELCHLEPQAVDTRLLVDECRAAPSAAAADMHVDATPISQTAGNRNGSAAAAAATAASAGPTPAGVAPFAVGAAATPGSFVTPSPMHAAAGPPAPPRAGAAAGAAPPPRLPPSELRPPPSSAAHRRKFVDDGKLRKVSGRLFADASSLRRAAATAPRGAGAAVGGGGGSGAGGAAGGVAESPCTGSGDSAGGGGGGGGDDAGYRAVKALLRILVEGYRQLCLYRCTEAVEAFQRLPARQYDTGWVFAALGRAYFEAVDYQRAEEMFQLARARDPYRLEGMEVYSTVLWHMRKEVALSHLAQECNALDRLAPQAWCVMGNCFSLQKEHETALKSFTRALQLDPTLAYAYTLRGHELFANEDFDEALKAYRQAIRIDARHYNARYGIGQVFLRQEKWQLAEKQFRRALEYNGRSSVLRCYLGSALAKLGRTSDALEQLQAAIDSDPRNPLARFERASVLVAEERYGEAHEQLLHLKEMIPREASVFFQLGKVCKRLGRLDDAMMHYCAALDLQPPASDVNLIKSAIEKIRIMDDNEEEEV